MQPSKDSPPSRAGYLTVLSWFPESGVGGVNQAVLNLVRTMGKDGRWRPLFLVSNGKPVPQKQTQLDCTVLSLYVRAPDIPAERPVRSLLAFLATLPATLGRLRRLLREHEVKIV